ncbi:DUF5343 domain-containing protein [Salinibacterium sp. SWN139]|uniref:DUF5343 domain-containing protein n=1 Tax=Salinibacterium sp. SWN139 TaxID=2792055 RepID=UPI0018CD11E8|nr:DUF5343 domain-containing protein [Salinibacterium sp. SWN139]MBH0053776.1 DUF5343 domain-containing protein [Salinibacterium sp. SWN139]
MPTEIPYMLSVTNLPAILEKIRAAGTPPRFTHDFLKSTLGFTASQDRPIIKILRALGFLSADGAPTARYNEFKGERSGAVLAMGLREGWPDLFMADQKIYEKTTSQIMGVVKTVSGASESVAQKMASTFRSLCDKADWSGNGAERDASLIDSSVPETDDSSESPEREPSNVSGAKISGTGLFQLHHDVHIHLPPTTDVSVYRAIFQAIKAELM